MKLSNEVNWYGRAMGRYATFSGRSTRSEFWYFTLVSGLLSFGASLLDSGLRTGGTLYLIVTLVQALPSLSVLVRRLHDTDRTGWWVMAALTVVGIIPLFVFVCQRGTATTNRFGAPLGRDGRPVSAVAHVELTSGPARDPISEVERLADLRAKGAITDAEFERMKAAVFGAPGSAAASSNA